jgi:hypothetical protein
MRNSLLSESFLFRANGTEITMEVAESLIFPAVREQLSVDGSARKFFVENSRIETADIHSLQLVLSGETISIQQSQRLLSGLLGNVNLELLFLDCSKAAIRTNLSDLVMERRIDLESVDVSVEALDSLLLSESISVRSEDALLRLILKLGPGYRDLLRHIQIGFLSANGLSLLDEHFEIPSESIWQCAVERIAHLPSPLDSRIISVFPDIFAEFQGKQFLLLWRGSRDGCKAREFHRRCDRQANTLTVILDTNGNIFGGFTPVEWESQRAGGWGLNCWKADGSQRSFVFTLKNPHNVPPRRFVLKVEKKQQAIGCNSERGPDFYDIRVYDNCNANAKSFTSLGNAYTNGTGVDGRTFFTGSFDFKVKEIEVFKITDYTALSRKSRSPGPWKSRKSNKS